MTTHDEDNSKAPTAASVLKGDREDAMASDAAQATECPRCGALMLSEEGICAACGRVGGAATVAMVAVTPESLMEYGLEHVMEEGAYESPKPKVRAAPSVGAQGEGAPSIIVQADIVQDDVMQGESAPADRRLIYALLGVVVLAIAAASILIIVLTQA